LVPREAMKFPAHLSIAGRQPQLSPVPVEEV
jgi:hypothetical protein